MKLPTAGSNGIYSQRGRFLPGSESISPRHWEVFLPDTGEDWAALPSYVGLNQSPQGPQPQHTPTQCARFTFGFSNILQRILKRNYKFSPYIQSFFFLCQFIMENLIKLIWRTKN